MGVGAGDPCEAKENRLHERVEVLRQAKPDEIQSVNVGCQQENVRDNDSGHQLRTAEQEGRSVLVINKQLVGRGGKCITHYVASKSVGGLPLCCVCPCVVSALCCVCTVLCLPHSCQTHRGASEAEKVLQNQSHYEQNEDEERVEDIGCSDVAWLCEVTCLLPEPPPANLQGKKRTIAEEERREGRREKCG